MKIFAVELNNIKKNKERVGALYKQETPVILPKVASTLLKDGKPFLIPNWTKQEDNKTEVL